MILQFLVVSHFVQLIALGTELPAICFHVIQHTRSHQHHPFESPTFDYAECRNFASVILYCVPKANNLSHDLNYFVTLSDYRILRFCVERCVCMCVQISES